MGDNSPYIIFGKKLRSLRERAKETLMEVSGAVEIDETTLVNIESGNQLPEEDILALLVSHFDVSEREALHLWDLAGYSKESTKAAPLLDDLKQIMMVIPFDNRVIYSDTAHIAVNENGVVIDFGLVGDDGVQPQTVSRVGMSTQQAEKLVKQLAHSIYMSRQQKTAKALPAPKVVKKTTKKKRP